MPPAFRFLLLGGALLLAAGAVAQQAEPVPAPASPTVTPADTAQARSVAEAFRHGYWHGRVRNAFFATFNHDSLPDYYAIGIGAGVRFETRSFHGVQLGAGGFFWANTASNDLAASRYEAGLFDVTQPGRRRLTGRPEELFVRYRHRGLTATFGRQLLTTPLLNPQDGRLSPTYAQGLWLELRPRPATTLSAAWLTAFAPRSTTDWYSAAGSVGRYSMGLTETGQRAAYLGQLRSRGVGVLGLEHQFSPATRGQAWNYFAENLFHDSFAELTTVRPLRRGRLTLGGQYHYQRTVGTGGNRAPALTYSAPGRQAHALSTRLGYQRGPWILSASYTRITRTGRFLFPREWGRDAFYTFLPRERNEGFGGVNATLLLAGYSVARVPGLRLEAGYGHYCLPDVRNVRLNKYGLPSYRQLNASVAYPFRGWAAGLRGQLLYVYKGGLGSTYGEARYVMNKVDMHLLNVLLHYDF